MVMDDRFIASRAEAIANVYVFNTHLANRHGLPKEQERDLRVMLAKTELFAVGRDAQGHWHAGPSKYITLANVTPALYSQIRRSLNSGNAANLLREWLPETPVDKSHPGWKEVERIAKAHTIGGHPQRDALAFMLFDDTVAANTVDVNTSKQAAVQLSILEQREIDLMVALARVMRPEVLSHALHAVASNS